MDGGKLSYPTIRSLRRRSAGVPASSLVTALRRLKPMPTPIASPGSRHSAGKLRRAALGVSQDEQPSEHSERLWDKALPQARRELQRKLLAVAGWPDCRAEYQENLADARGMASYYRMLIKHPERRSKGTGSDEFTLRRKLKEEEREVRYRQRLLRELEAVQEEYRPRGAVPTITVPD